MSVLDVSILEKLGKLTREIRKEVSTMPKVGMDITEIIDFIEKKIFSHGYLPSFPAMVSVNDMAAHYTVYDKGYVLQKGDVIKIDFGISQDGFMTDNAFTVEIETNKHEKLIQTAKDCLDAAMDVVNVGVSMNDIGEAVNNTAKKNGFNTIHNLSGHQIGQYELHFGLSVPNFANGDKQEVPKNSQFAIEPFVTYGEPKIKGTRLSNIVHLKGDRPVRDPIAKKLLMHIRENFPKQPFSKRWLVQDVIDKNLEGTPNFKGFDLRKVNYGISILKREGGIYEYDELGTIDGEIVAQFEDCVIFNDDQKTIITRLR